MTQDENVWFDQVAGGIAVNLVSRSTRQAMAVRYALYLNRTDLFVFNSAFGSGERE